MDKLFYLESPITSQTLMLDSRKNVQMVFTNKKVDCEWEK